MSEGIMRPPDDKKPSLLPLLMVLVLLAIPVLLLLKTTVTEYRSLADMRFQLEKAQVQKTMIGTRVRHAQATLDTTLAEFTPLTGERSQALAALQTDLRNAIGQANGVVNTIVPSNQTHGDSTAMVLTPLTLSIRWTGDEDALWQFLQNMSTDDHAMIIDQYTIRPMRTGLGELDIRMHISALWKPEPGR